MTPSWASSDLARARAVSPLAPLVPLATALLAPAANEAGLAVVVTDPSGRPLWFEADDVARNRLEEQGVGLGRPWRAMAPVLERRAPLRFPAPDTPLPNAGSAAPIGGEPAVGPSSAAFCAAPVRDPRTGELAGAIAVTGGPAASNGFVLAALRGAAAVVESHLATRVSAPQESAPVGSSSALALLRLTGPDAPTLDTPYGTTQLNQRHAELLAVLADAPAGLTGTELGARVFSAEVSAVTLRAEITRLRRTLEFSGALEAGVGFSSRPYRLTGVETDEARVGTLLDRGALQRALTEYGGELLPGSTSPEMVMRRRRLSSAVRGAVMASGSLADVLAWLRLPEADADVKAWELAADLVPASSPHHARVLAHLASLS